MGNILYAGDRYTIDQIVVTRKDNSEYLHQRVTPAQGLGAVVVLSCIKRGVRYLGLVLQERPVIGKESLEFVRGATDALDGEEALRELEEETGIKVAPQNLRWLGVINPDTGALTTTVGVWTVAVQPEVMESSAEHEEWESGITTVWLSKGEFIGKISRGEITCGMTLAAFALADSQGSLYELLP